MGSTTQPGRAQSFLTLVLLSLALVFFSGCKAQIINTPGGNTIRTERGNPPANPIPTSPTILTVTNLQLVWVTNTVIMPANPPVPPVATQPSCNCCTNAGVVVPPSPPPWVPELIRVATEASKTDGKVEEGLENTKTLIITFGVCGIGITILICGATVAIVVSRRPKDDDDDDNEPDNALLKKLEDIEELLSDRLPKKIDNNSQATEAKPISVQKEPQLKKSQEEAANEYKELLNALESALGQMEDIKKMPQADEQLISKMGALQDVVKEEIKRLESKSQAQAKPGP